MIVLGYLSATKEHSILVPPFHTGHLGLLPTTEVNLRIVAPHGVEHTNCELLISSVPRKPDLLMQITCVMDDKPGVVSRLIEAVSDLQINIISQESSAINHMNQHLVELLVDWSTSPQITSNERTPSSAKRAYRNYAGVFPLGDGRCVALFNSIMLHCADVITCDGTLPRLAFRTLRVPSHEQHHGTAIIQRINDVHFTMKCAIPDSLVAYIRQRVGAATDESLPYILVSDTEDRALRVCFPKPCLADSIVHVGFRHFNLPGALACLTPIVAAANYNLLTSLLRKKNNGQSVWEALLEYRGTKKVPKLSDCQSREDYQKEVVNFVAGEFIEAAKKFDTELIRNFGLAITSPEYPRLGTEHSVVLNELLEGRKGRATPRKSRQEMLVERHAAIKENAGVTNAQAREDILRVVESIERWQPRVFLSYPARAKEHGELVKKYLTAEGYAVDEYQLPRGEVIADEVIEKIDSCDVFVGIWHHEDGKSGHYISPWMPFEYGIARAFQRECVMVHSTALDPEVWRRISPEVAHPGYTDLKFETEIVPVIIRDVKQKAPLVVAFKD